MSEWDSDRNGSLTPDTVSAYGNTKVWWKCAKGHRWEASVANRAQLGRGCPVCAGKQVLSGENDLRTLYPALASEWNDNRNGDLRPEKVRPGTHRIVWWRCPVCGNEWEAEVKSRVAGNGCPYCSGKRVLPGFNDLATTNPDIAAQWDWARNTDLSPTQVTKGSGKQVWWKCPSCGHSYRKSVGQKVKSPKCPHCRAMP